MLNIQPFLLGPLGNNTYLLSDPETKQAVLIDPSFGIQSVLRIIQQQRLTLSEIWLTHAHFDHIAGISEMAKMGEVSYPIYLHPDDVNLYQQRGGGDMFGFYLQIPPNPTLPLIQGDILHLGSHSVEIRFTPGHTPGHVVFYLEENQVVFSGDVIFQRSIGRTDLPGSSHPALLQSIKQQILTLPPETRILSGHGPETKVGIEQRTNPFIR